VDAVEEADRLFRQALDLWVNPEIEERRSRRLIDDGFALHSAQVIFPSPLDARANYVRLNDEVKAVARVKINRPTSVGDHIRESDIEDFEAVRLPENDEPNAGHLTMVRISQKWFIGFDFRRDKKRACEHITRADEFLRAARLSFRQGLVGPGLDALHSAAELAAKAELLLFMAYLPARPRDLKDHGFLRGRYGRWTGLGNAPKPANSALKQLSQLRRRARYLEGGHHLKRGQLLKSVSAMIGRVRKQLDE